METQTHEAPVTKQCTKCGGDKPIEQFNSNISNKDGLHVWCKSCLKQYRQMNKESIAKVRERYMNNGGRDKRTEYYSKNREKVLIRQKNRIESESSKERHRMASSLRYYNNKDEILKLRREVYHSNYEKSLWKKAKARAKRKHLDFNIEVSDILIPEICPILGIAIVKNNNKVYPNSPSLDRIDNTKGYIKGNIRVISHGANSMKKDFTVDLLERMLFYMKMSG